MTVRYLERLRKQSYYKNYSHINFIEKFVAKWNSLCLRHLSILTGIQIGCDTFGYGLLIPHFGTIIVNGGCRIGNYAVLHTSTCIGGCGKTIGDGLYLSSGGMIMGELTLGDGVSVAANSLVNKSAGSYMLLTGSPAEVKKNGYPIWYLRDGPVYKERVERIEKLKKQMGIKE